MEKPNVGRAILGGFVGTLVMTMIMYAAPMMSMPKMDIAAMLGSMLNGGQMPALMSGPWLMGMMMHLFDGIIIFPLIYAFLLFRILPGSPWLRGVIWGLILWLLSQGMVMPMMGMGVFSANAPRIAVSRCSSCCSSMSCGLSFLSHRSGALRLALCAVGAHEET